MKKSLLVLSIALLGTLLSSNVMGQAAVAGTTLQNLTLGLPELSLVSTSAATVALLLTATDAGKAVDLSVSDQTARVMFSSVIGLNKPHTMTAKVTSGLVPAGTTLKLIALPPNASYVGLPVSYATEATLTSTDSNIITNIQSCYTGAVAGDGFVLKYTWGLDTVGLYSDIRATLVATPIVVTLTLSAGL